MSLLTLAAPLGLLFTVLSLSRAGKRQIQEEAGTPLTISLLLVSANVSELTGALGGPCLLHVKLCVTSNISGKEYSLLLSPPVLKFYSPLPYIWSSVSDYHSSISPYPQTTIPGTYFYIREQVRSKYKLNDQREPLPEALGLILNT